MGRMCLCCVGNQRPPVRSANYKIQTIFSESVGLCVDTITQGWRCA